MGLFGKKETCTICNQNEGNKKISDGIICDKCLSKCGYFIIPIGLKNKTSNQIVEAIKANERNSELASMYKTTKKIEKYLDVDEKNKLWGSPQFSPHIFFTYDDIVSFELLENGNPITKGGIGTAVVGGALFGGVGAIVGGSVGKKKTKQEITEFRIKIITRNPVYPEIYINFLTTGKVMSNSMVYNSYAQSAQNVLTALALMSTEKMKVENDKSLSPADEIVKYKTLLDDGIITQEEFETKKKQLLGV